MGQNDGLDGILEWGGGFWGPGPKFIRDMATNPDGWCRVRSFRRASLGP